MKNEEIIEINKKGWDDLIKSNKKFANTSLPDYGPFLKRNEEEINLFNDLQNKSILDLGCAQGKSLEYLLNKGASEIWGIDISEEQIQKAKEKFPQ